MFIIRFFQAGGLFMYPILITLSIGLAMAFERWVQLKRESDANKKLLDTLFPVLEKGEFEKAREIVNDDQSSLAQMLAASSEAFSAGLAVATAPKAAIRPMMVPSSPNRVAMFESSAR